MRIWAELFHSLSQSTCLSEGETDRQRAFSSLYHVVCSAFSAVKIDVILSLLQLSEIHCEFDLPLTTVYLHVATFDSTRSHCLVEALKYTTGMQHARAEAP